MTQAGIACLFKPVHQQATVGQLRQRIVKSQCVNLRLRFDPFADVAEDGHEVCGRTGMIPDRADAEPLGIDLATLAPVPDLTLPGTAVAQALHHGGVKSPVMATRRQQTGVMTNGVLGAKAGDDGKGTVDPENHVVGVGNHHALLGFKRGGSDAQRFVGLFALCHKLVDGVDQDVDLIAATTPPALQSQSWCLIRIPEPSHVLRQLMQVAGNLAIHNGEQHQRQANDLDQVGQHQGDHRVNNLGVGLGVRLGYPQGSDHRFLILRQHGQRPDPVNRSGELRLMHIGDHLVQTQHLGPHHRPGEHQPVEHRMQSGDIELPQRHPDCRKALTCGLPRIDLGMAQRLVALIGDAKRGSECKHGKTGQQYPHQDSECQHRVPEKPHRYFPLQMAE